MRKLSSVFGISILLLGACGTAEESTNNEAVEETQENVETVSTETNVNGTTDDRSEMTKEQAQNVLNDYKETFLKVIDAGPELEEYQSKDEITQHFSTIMTSEYAQSLVDTYIQEDNGELSVVATETPIWLQEDKDYSLKEVSEGEYHVIQNINNQLRGNKEVTFKLVMEEDSWIVADVITDSDGQEEGKYKTGADDQVEGDLNSK